MARILVLLLSFFVFGQAMAGTPDHFVLATSHGGTETVGVPFKIVLIALDSDENVAEAYSGPHRVQVAVDSRPDDWGTTRGWNCEFVNGLCSSEPFTIPESVQASEVLLYASDGPDGLVDAFAIPLRLKH